MVFLVVLLSSLRFALWRAWLSVLAVADAVVVVANSKLGWLWLVIHLEPGLPGAARGTVIGLTASFWQLKWSTVHGIRCFSFTDK